MLKTTITIATIISITAMSSMFANAALAEVDDNDYNANDKATKEKLR